MEFAHVVSLEMCQGATVYRSNGALALGCIAVLFTIVLPFGCNKSTPTAGTISPPKVTIATALEQDIIDYDEFVGRTEASETVEVRSRVSGFVKSVEFQDGSSVTKDQLLFKIEPDLYQAIHQQSLSRIELWKAKKELADSKFARSKSLLPSGSISREEYDESVAAVKESEASIVAAKADADRTALDVKYTEIRAEVAGRIDRALVTPGNLVTGGVGSGTFLTRIVSNDPIYAYLDIDERTVIRYLRRMNPKWSASGTEGSSATPLSSENTARASLINGEIPCYMQLADEKDFPHVGKIDFVENRVDSSTGSIRIRGVFANADWMFTGGLFVRIRVPVSESYRAVLVPEQAIGTDQNIKYAYVVGADNIPQRRSLVLGAQRGNMRVVKSGIDANQKVIYRGLQLIKPGKEVTPETVEPILQNVDSGSHPAKLVWSAASQAAPVPPAVKSNPE